jgi:hypothetical protein
VTDQRNKLWREGSRLLGAEAGIEKEPGQPFFDPRMGKSHHFVAYMEDAAAISAYYAMARQFLHHHRFASAAQRRIWELHSESVSVKRIESYLRREGRRGRVKHEVQTHIAALRAKMLNQRPRGRPRNPEGHGEGGERLVLRLSVKETEALGVLRAAWGEKYRTKRHGVSSSKLVRALIVECARGVHR